jgi:hypothetical protein
MLAHLLDAEMFTASQVEKHAIARFLTQMSVVERVLVRHRLRLFRLDRWNPWPRLTRYRSWAGPSGETVDGTNNACERAIRWWVKECYRSMRGYKRPLSVLHVRGRIAAKGNALNGPGFALAEVIA